MQPSPTMVVLQLQTIRVLTLSLFRTIGLAPSLPPEPGLPSHRDHIDYTNVLTDLVDQDYTAAPITFTISGNAGVDGAILNYNDGSPKTAITDGSGNYFFTVSYNWSGVITPSKTGSNFSPDHVDYTNVLADFIDQNYDANPITFIISGTAGVGGATISYTDGTPKTATTDGSGNYSLTVPYNWSGTVSLHFLTIFSPRPNDCTPMFLKTR